MCIHHIFDLSKTIDKIGGTLNVDGLSSVLPLDYICLDISYLHLSIDTSTHPYYYFVYYIPFHYTTTLLFTLFFIALHDIFLTRHTTNITDLPSVVTSLEGVFVFWGIIPKVPKSRTFQVKYYEFPRHYI